MTNRLNDEELAFVEGFVALRRERLQEDQPLFVLLELMARMVDEIREHRVIRAKAAAGTAMLDEMLASLKAKPTPYAKTGQPAPVEGWPAHEPPQYNRSSSPCDAWRGPCSCGAWHDGKRVKPIATSMEPTDVQRVAAQRRAETNALTADDIEATSMESTDVQRVAAQRRAETNALTADDIEALQWAVRFV